MFWISITIAISVGIDWIRPRLESMRNEVNNDYYDLVVEIDDLIMKQSEKVQTIVALRGDSRESVMMLPGFTMIVLNDIVLND